ncbi:DUF3331 domain-containing protein [Cupriavidus necator]|uniref:DUF3331 domain-containing protein n=1 Tax=Cupriavidus necator TaxID=106590 RepID=UPI0009B8095D|nr:DUF3331 domain-containing protein [Cupriavidus necator]
MQDASKVDRAWFHTMALLNPEGDGIIHAPQPHPACPEYQTDSRQPCAIKVLERRSLTTATVAWSDSTTGHYGEQLWQRVITRRSGICAVSGRVIAEGDAVYRPRFALPTPRNAAAMILASVMEAIPSADYL